MTHIDQRMQVRQRLLVAPNVVIGAILVLLC